MNKIKVVMIVSLLACIILSASLVGMILNYQALEQKKNEEYRESHFRLIDEISVAYNYWENWTRWKQAEVNETEIYPKDQHYFIEEHSELYESLLNDYDPSTLTTVIMHGSIKESQNMSLPNVPYTYQKLCDGFAAYEVLILPEYNGNLDFTETLKWISSNFSGVPICLSVFEGGNESWPNPNVKLTTAEIEQVIAVSDVRMVRFAEMISWYMDANRTFPIDEVMSVLEFCRSKNIKVLWNEWKISDKVLPFLNETLFGFEDLVTVVYQTNNEFDEPFIGYLYSTQFEHWGASVQSWYWEEHGYDVEEEMPIDVMVEHAVLARNMGAEVIQFEPYWYFFGSGEPLETMYMMWSKFN